MSQPCDFDKALKALQSGQALTGKYGILTPLLERKIIRLFALGMSYQDISHEIEDLYAFSVSAATISAVTDKLIPALKQWQQHPLEKVYPLHLAVCHAL